MMSFIQINKKLLTYFFIFFIFISFFGFNLLLNILGNVLLIILLVPLLIFLIALISLNSLKPELIVCDQCGSVSLSLNDNCNNCGADLNRKNPKNADSLKNASETTIEIKAEEIN